jgi:hypothetical protein
MPEYDSATGLTFGQKGDDKSIVSFFTTAEKHNFKSEQAGHPVFEDVEMVSIIIPGDRRTEVVERVKEEHRQRWPRQYEAFKAGQEAPLDGYPLSEWPPMTPAMVANLKVLNIRTVEQLASVGDSGLQNLGMGAQELRKKAQAFLKTAAEQAPIAELEAREKRLQEELAVRDNTIAALQQAVAKLEAQANAAV